MNSAYRKAGASTVGAEIDRSSAGGFVAIASNGDVDRDGERILPGCFDPLPASIPVHLDHTMRASSVVARGRPYYRGGVLMIDATFASTTDAQEVRTKVADGTLDSLSIVFLGSEWRDVDGVRTCVKGELLAADIVSVPSNRGARILSMRSVGSVGDARRQIADALLEIARADVRECQSLLRAIPGGPHRRHVDDLIREALNPETNPTTEVRRILRSL